MRVGRVSGSLYGRAVGVAMCYMWQSVTGTPYPTGMWRWIDPGVMAAVGAAGLLGGVNRIATASTVIVVRIPWKIGCYYFPPGLQLPSQPFRGCYQFCCLVNRVGS